jgi:Zn-dependent protease
MKWSLKLGRVAGIKIFVHWSFLLLIGWVVFAGMRQGLEIIDTVWTIIFVLTVFGCVTLHELGHAITAKRYNIKTRDIILLPIGGLARFERMPEDPSQELLIAIAGPLVNVAIAAVIYFIMSFVTGIPDLSEFTAINAHNFLYMLLFVNVLLAVFNMIPAFPMDGGRVLRAILSFKYPRHQATRVASGIGQVLSIGFVILGLFYNPFLIIIGIFIYLGAQAEADFTQARSFLKGYRVRDVIMHHFNKLNLHDTLGKAVKILLDGQGKDFLIVDENNEVAGTLSRNEMIKGLSEKGKDAPVESVMNTKVVYINPDVPLEEMYSNIQGNGASIMPVIENGELIGALDTENILEFIMVKEAEKKREISRY